MSPVRRLRSRTAALALALALATPALAQAVPSPFAGTSLPAGFDALPPGAVVASRTGAVSLFGMRTPLRMVQLRYRSEDQLGRAVPNVTSVLLPPNPRRSQEVVSYQSFYDSLDPADSPSRALAGGTTLGGLIPSIEHAFLLDELSRGRTVVITDTEGERADLIAAPEYGKHTLNGLRAALASPRTGLGARARIALLGYSGGALATEWAAELAPSYAPDIDARLVGAAMGGVLVDPQRNLQYTSGSAVWSVVLGLAIVGLERSFDVDVRPALNAYGRRVFRELERASIANAIGRFPGLTWRQIARPEYPTIASVPGFLGAANALRMGRGARPSAPLFIAQGTRGELEGTRGDRPGIGAGDGIAIAGDVRTLARGYCERGLSITYREYAASHVGAMVPWMPAASRWIGQRFRGLVTPNDCARIPAGNALGDASAN